MLFTLAFLRFVITLFTVLFEFSLCGTVSDVQISNYRLLIDNYNDDELLETHFPEYINDIYSYKALSKEGTRQKTNRVERHRVIKEIINNYVE